MKSVTGTCGCDMGWFSLGCYLPGKPPDLRQGRGKPH